MNRKSFKLYCWGLLLLLVGLTSCEFRQSFQQQIPIKNGIWSSDQIPEYTFYIEDTTKVYAPFILLRLEDGYPFSNIWLRMIIQLPNDTAYTDSFQVEIPLADNDGYWLGNDQGSFWTYKIALSKKKFNDFKSSGPYKVKIQHLMRKDPLPGIINIGWRVDEQ